MRKKLLMMIVPIFGAFSGYSQPELTVTAPSATTSTGLRAPNGTSAHTTVRGVIIITAAELAAIPTGTPITKISFIMAAGVAPGPAGGNIQMYLENTADVTNLKSTTWSTTITGMTSVYSGAYAIPAVAGPTSDLTLSTGFTYTGGSVYVAYDYLGTTFTTTAGTYSANSTIGGGWKGIVDPTTTPPATLSQSSAFRPCFRFTFANPFTNELNVTGVAGEKGIFNNTIKTTQTVTSQITNTSVGALTNVPVTLTVAGANPYTVTQTILSIGAGATNTLLFNNVPSINLGTQTVTISIPADQNNSNNSQVFNQKVQCDTIGYAQNSTQGGGVGFNTGTGLIGVKHTIPGNIDTYVKSISNYFPTATANTGNTLKGLLLNSAGVIIDSTSLITITAGMLGTKADFNFINGAIDVSGTDIYLGFRQTANATTGYFPFANQPNSYVDPNAGATFPVDGGTPAPLGSGLGYMMIEATLTFGGFDVANTSTNGDVCANSTLGINPTAGYSYYQFFVNSANVQNGATATYTTVPLTAATTFNVSITNGACVLNSNVQSIAIVTSLVNNISAGICPGQTYAFGGQNLTAAGSYSDTVPSSLGCDSIINLTLSSLAATSSAISAAICQGNSYQFQTQTLTTGGTYTATIPNVAGCDSVITLTLTIKLPTTSSSTLAVCANSYQFGGQNITANGTYTRTIPNAAGCDSVITLNITLNTPVVATAAVSGITLSATSTTTATYQWVNCPSNSVIAGATGASYTATANGSYAVIATSANGCSDTSTCVTVNTIGLDEMTLNSSVTIYPNPAVSELHVVSNGANILSYSVLDANGRIVIGKSINEFATEIEFSLGTISEGSYILELTTSEGKVYKRFVKK